MPTAKKTAAKKTPTKKQSVGELSTTKRDSLSTETSAFPKKRKESLNDASHVRLHRIQQIPGV